MSTIIHVGFHKCASTFLQMHVFPSLKTKKFVHWENDNEYVQLGSQYLNDIPKNNPIFNLPNDDLLISREGFMCSNPHLSLFKYGETKTKDIFFANISVLFKKKGKLLFVIRRQDSLMESWIRFKPTSFHDAKSAFIDFPVKTSDINKTLLDNTRGCYYLEYLDYFNIIMRIATALGGTDRIHVLRQEDISNNPEKFYSDLSDACEEDLRHFASLDIPPENTSKPTDRPPMILSSILEKLNWIKKTPTLSPATGILKKIFYRNNCQFSSKDKKDLMDIYKDGNRLLSKILDLDLDEYGYF